MHGSNSVWHRIDPTIYLYIFISFFGLPLRGVNLVVVVDILPD
jgi:hypothetical protein